MNSTTFGNDNRLFWWFVGLSLAGHCVLVFLIAPVQSYQQYSDRQVEQSIAVNLIMESAAPVSEPISHPVERAVDQRKITNRQQIPLETMDMDVSFAALTVANLTVEPPQVRIFQAFVPPPPPAINMETLPEKSETIEQLAELPLSQMPLDSSKGIVEEARPVGHVNRKPRYPRLAERRGWEGTVIIKIRIEPDGRASHFELHESSGYPILDEAALREIRKWQFHPAHRDGIRIASWITQPVEFTFND